MVILTMDFNKPITGLDGQPVYDGDKVYTLGRLLAEQLIQATKVDAIKFFDWALKLYNNQPLELDNSDTQTLKEFIRNHETMTVIAKAQLLSNF